MSVYNRPFIFEVPIEAPLHCKSNIPKILGTDAAFLPEYPRHTWAAEDIDQLIQDAFGHCMMMSLRCMSENGGEHTHLSKALSARAERWQKLREQVRCVRDEKVTK